MCSNNNLKFDSKAANLDSKNNTSDNNECSNSNATCNYSECSGSNVNCIPSECSYSNCSSSDSNIDDTIKRDYNRSINMWNDVYSKCKIVDLKGKSLSVEPMFDICLDIFASECKKVLDFGCGTGDVIFQCYEFGNMDSGLGIDLSETGIEFAKKFASVNKYNNLDFKVGDISYFDNFADGSFDGIILSNVLDVMPKDVALKTFKRLTDLLAPKGLMFVKINPFYEKSDMKEWGLTQIKDNLFEENGVLRYRELDTVSWKQSFEKHYEIIRYLEFPYPWQEGMNRLFLLQKKL